MFEKLGVLDRDVAPEHQSLVVRLHHLGHALEVFKVDAAQPHFIDSRFRLSATKLERLVRADVKQRAGKQRHKLRIKVFDQLVRFFIDRREHVAVRRFGQVVVDFVFEHVMQMAERLLLRKYCHVVTLARTRPVLSLRRQ